jgi:hypothetical protein
MTIRRQCEALIRYGAESHGDEGEECCGAVTGAPDLSYLGGGRRFLHKYPHHPHQLQHLTRVQGEDDQ